MNEENVKLAQIQKSCKAAKIVSKIFMIAAIVGCVLSLIASIVVFTNKDKYDEVFNAEDVTMKVGVGNFYFASFDHGDINSILDEEMTSDVPEIQEYFDENQHSGALRMGFFLIIIAVYCASLAVVMGFIASIFSTVLKEGNPFSDKVLKKVLVSMIIITVIIGASNGLGMCLVLALVTWVVYTILDYGRTLQKLSDETL